MDKAWAFDIGQEFWFGNREGTGLGQDPYPQTIGGWFSLILPNVYVLAGLIFLVLLVAGGLGIIFSAGKGDEKGVSSGQKTVVAALAGFLIIFLTYWIMQIIETITGLKFF